MKLEFDTVREEEIFREILKDAELTNVRPELMTEACQLMQKMVDYFGKKDLCKGIDKKCKSCNKYSECEHFREILNCILNVYGLEVVATGKN